MTLTEALLVQVFESAYDRWAEFEAVHGEREDIAEYRLWLEWLRLDLAAIELARRLKACGVIEAPGVTAQLDFETGKPVLFYDNQILPVLTPSHYRSTQFPRRKEVARAA